MIVLTLLAAAATTDCSDFASRAGENIDVTMTTISKEALGDIGNLKYMENGVVIRSSDPRFAGIQIGEYGFGHRCGYSVIIPWKGSTFVRYSRNDSWKAPPAINALERQTNTPMLDGYVAGTTTGHRASANGFLLALMYPVNKAYETVLVAYGTAPARVIAQLPMHFDQMMFLLNPHGPASQLELQGREADGTLNRVTFDIGGLQRDAMAREFGEPSLRSLNLCPIGGEPYEVTSVSSFSTMGQRPDGKPYSSIKFPLPVPECASNKVVVFDKFTGAEIGQLGDLILSPEYRRLTAEPAHYRAFWLATRLGRPPAQALNLLRQAIWEVTPDSGVAETRDSSTWRARYQAEFIAGVQQLPPAASLVDRLTLQSHAANAARQLGRFEQAQALRRLALATLQEAEQKSGWDIFLAKLGPVISRGDSSVEPLDLIPEYRIKALCGAGRPNTDFDIAVCSRTGAVR